MRVHHLNCGTMLPQGLTLVTHVLLVEGERGLVLVDSGYGLLDVADPRHRLGPIRHVLGATLDAAETAVRQVETLGYDAADVRDVVLTHLDLDHAGGLADFPAARVHVTSAEAAGAIWSPSFRERIRYRRPQWAHGPHLVQHDPGGDSWRGFAGAVPLVDVTDGLVLVPMPGHSRGHTAVAVDTDHGWVLHAGDAFYSQRVLEGRPAPRPLRLQEVVNAYDRKALADNQQRLAELHARREPDLTIVCAHDARMLREMQERASLTA